MSPLKACKLRFFARFRFTAHPLIRFFLQAVYASHAGRFVPDRIGPILQRTHPYDDRPLREKNNGLPRMSPLRKPPSGSQARQRG